MNVRTACPWIAVLAMSCVANATPCNLNGTWIEVDYWADDDSSNPTNETIVVIDWNDTHGPYLTESHAWGYRWSGTGTVLDALNGIDAGGPLDMEFGSGGGFVLHAEYYDASIDSDNHRTTDYAGWCWSASSADGGQTWDPNGGGVDVEPLGDKQIEALNWNPGSWTGDNLTIPVPEPATAGLLTLAGLVGLRRRKPPKR